MLKIMWHYCEPLDLVASKFINTFMYQYFSPHLKYFFLAWLFLFVLKELRHEQITVDNRLQVAN